MDAPAGTVVATLLALQLVTVAAMPFKVTKPFPCDAPKLLPDTVTGVPTAPDTTLSPEMLGVPKTVKDLPPLLTPLAKTTTLPVVAPTGTVATMLLAPQLVTLANIPLNFSVPVPWLAPKLLPAMVTGAPKAPDVGDKLLILGATTTVKLFPLLATLDTVTTTFPVVAPLGTVTVMLLTPQLVAVAVVPLNLTVLVPCGDPKLVPAITIEAPTAPLDGVRLVIVGAANALRADTRNQEVQIKINRNDLILLSSMRKASWRECRQDRAGGLRPPRLREPL